MHKGLNIAVLGGLIVMTCFGCQTVRNVELKAYLQDKPRLDQNRESGNSGYLLGSVEDTQKHKKTRKIYVIEFTKPLEDTDAVMIENDMTFTSTGSTQTGFEEEMVIERRLELPDFGDEEFYEDEYLSVEDQSAELIDYTVEKDDTLQKISKKFYNSFSQWPRIYDLNRDKISNPDVLKPGITIRIPVDK